MSKQCKNKMNGAGISLVMQTASLSLGMIPGGKNQCDY